METQDWLSRLLELIPVSGALDFRCMLGAPWQIDFPSLQPGEIPYHVVLEGAAILEESEDGPRQALAAGDIVLFPNGSAHMVCDGSATAPVPGRYRQTLSVTIYENDGAGDRLDMMCGRFILPARDRLIRSYLPRRMIVRTAGAAGSRAGEQVTRLVELMRTESGAENLGGLAMLNALSAALFTFTLRLASELGPSPDGLLALAANPRLAPALAAMFNEPGRRWTLPQLARLCNMSRATFIRHFEKSFGHSASDLLTDIRMTVAANALKTSELSTGAVAALVGYESEAAFQRAFKHRMGATPAGWRRDARAG